MIQLSGNYSERGMRTSPFTAAAVVACILAISACASAPTPPNRALQAAESAITNAERERVADYASTELRLAREKLAAAQAAARNEDMVKAGYLAAEARVHADLATARAEELKAKAINDEMKRSIETLRQEMQRTSGGRT